MLGILVFLLALTALIWWSCKLFESIGWKMFVILAVCVLIDMFVIVPFVICVPKASIFIFVEI